jgi:flagellar basal body-associated protein FliL
MKKSPLYMTMLMILAVASLFAFAGYSVFPSSGSVAATAFLQEETPTPRLPLLK